MNPGDVIKSGKWIDFVFMQAKPKTNVYSVMNREYSEEIGRIFWYSPWRKYVLKAVPDCVFEITCLRDIASFLTELQAKRSQKGVIGL